MVRNVITNLDLSKLYGSDCIPVVVLTNCEPEFSYILAELFIMYLKVSCFLDCWKVSSVAAVFKNIWERSIANKYHPKKYHQVIGTFGQIANSVLNKDRSVVPPLFSRPEVLSSASDKAKLFAKNISSNCNLQYLFTSFPFQN